VHHTATGDRNSSGYEVILMISLVICHDKRVRRWGVKWRMSVRETKAE
jgi:hypothetical protein